MELADSRMALFDCFLNKYNLGTDEIFSDQKYFPWISKSLYYLNSLVGGSDGKEFACNVGDLSDP